MKTMNFCLNMKFRIQTSFISPKKGIFFGKNCPSYALFIPVPDLKVPLLFRKLRKKVVFLFKFLFGYGIVIMDWNGGLESSLRIRDRNQYSFNFEITLTAFVRVEIVKGFVISSILCWKFFRFQKKWKTIFLQIIKNEFSMWFSERAYADTWDSWTVTVPFLSQKRHSEIRGFCTCPSLRIP